MITVMGLMAMCKFGRLKWVIMGNNRGQHNDVIMCNNDIIMESSHLHNM